MTAFLSWNVTIIIPKGGTYEFEADTWDAEHIGIVHQLAAIGMGMAEEVE